MKTNTLSKIILSFAATALLVATSEAETINLDIQVAGASPTNYTGASANGPIASGTTWNYFNVATGGANNPNSQSFLNLVDDGGAATDVDVAFGLGWVGTFESGTGNNLQGDRAYTQFQSTGWFTISGLEVGGSYNLALIASPDGSHGTDYTIAGAGTETATGGSAGTNVNGALTFTEGVTHVLFENIVASGGEITIGIKQASGSSAAVLSGLQIQSIPEPSSAALLLGLGSIALILRRRK